MKIAITAETTIDIQQDLLDQYEIRTIPFTLIMGEETALDGEVKSEDLFAFVEKTGNLPRTSALNANDYKVFFEKQLKEYDVVIHFTLSSGITSSCEHALDAAEEFKGKVFVIDTKSLSTGIALQAIYARKLARIGLEPAEIVKRVEERIPYDQTSFSLESVNYLYKGGRCSKLAMIGANLLRLKPGIYVKDGKMGPGKMYRGNMMRAVMDYVNDTLAKFNNPDKEEVFITFSSAPEEVVDAVRDRLLREGFENIHATYAGATISCHCGPHCLGILYMNDGPHPIA